MAKRLLDSASLRAEGSMAQARARQNLPSHPKRDELIIGSRDATLPHSKPLSEKKTIRSKQASPVHPLPSVHSDAYPSPLRPPLSPSTPPPLRENARFGRLPLFYAGRLARVSERNRSINSTAPLCRRQKEQPEKHPRGTNDPNCCRPERGGR
ncbi:hypothetical protein MTO96_005040 [Rhipicephalus appendiculatus]